MDININQLIVDKEATLVILKNDVAVIERQLMNLKASLAAASEPTEFEKMLISKAATVATGFDLFASSSQNRGVVGHPDLNSANLINGAARMRNPKGSVKTIALSVLNFQDKTLDEIEIEINKQAPKPVSRAAVRTLMMYFKRDGKVISSGQGVFRLAQKGEASADSRSAKASSASEA